MEAKTTTIQKVLGAIPIPDRNFRFIAQIGIDSSVNMNHNNSSAAFFKRFYLW